jgi:hypothetical protein
MHPKARTTTAIHDHSARDRDVIAVDERGVREAETGDGVAISFARLARLLRGNLSLRSDEYPATPYIPHV